MPVSTLQIGNKQVIFVDCSKSAVASHEDIVSTLQKGSALVATKPEKSVYIITNVKDLPFNTAVSNAFKEYASANTKYVKASVLVGLSGLQQVIFSAIKALTGREYKLVDTLEQAKEYFASLL